MTSLSSCATYRVHNNGLHTLCSALGVHVKYICDSALEKFRCLLYNSNNDTHTLHSALQVSMTTGLTHNLRLGGRDIHLGTGG